MVSIEGSVLSTSNVKGVVVNSTSVVTIGVQ